MHEHRPIEVEHHPIGAAALAASEALQQRWRKLQQQLTPAGAAADSHRRQPVRHLQPHLITEGPLRHGVQGTLLAIPLQFPSVATAEAQLTLQQIQRQPERLRLVIARPLPLPGAGQALSGDHDAVTAATGSRTHLRQRFRQLCERQHEAREERMAPA